MFKMRVLPVLLLGAFGAASSDGAFPEIRGITAQGHAFVSGGVAEGGREALREQILSPARPSARYRAIHLRTVLRSTPKRAATAATGSPATTA